MAAPTATGQKIGAIAFRRHIESHGLLEAGRLINPGCATDEQAQTLIRLYIEGLLAQRKTVSAGVVLWGERMFNPYPVPVRRVWAALNNYQAIIIPGGASQGKTYTAVTWLMTRWWQDPAGTTIKLISVTGKHAESNIFGTIKMLHKMAVVPMPGVQNADSIALEGGEKRAGIHIVRIRQGEDNSEVLQGFHPLPRQDTHPIFGNTTSVIAALDECEGIPNGVWTGTSNMKASGDKDHVKIMAFYNPKDITAPPAQKSEPVGGWGEFDVETGVQGKDEWVSREGWYVVRLDPKKTENVQERRVVHEGFQTYEANREYEEKEGGNSQQKYVFGRGCYPPDSAENAVTPQRVITAMRGEFVFSGLTTRCAGADTAVDGRDEAIMSVGRFGKARAFKHYLRGPTGQMQYQLITFKKERDAIQLDQQFAVKKGSTKIVAEEFKAHCLRLQIEPQWFMLDATGNGEPVFILLSSEAFWSPKVRGIRFGDDATATKVLEEDKKLANEQFDGITSEVLFAITRLGEFGYLAISPSVASDALERELIGRRYKLGPGETLKVEDKKEYKKRLGRSPDHGDSFSIFVHCARTGGKVEKAAIMEANRRGKTVQFNPNDVDTVQWLPPDGGV